MVTWTGRKKSHTIPWFFAVFRKLFFFQFFFCSCIGTGMNRPFCSLRQGLSGLNRLCIPLLSVRPVGLYGNAGGRPSSIVPLCLPQVRRFGSRRHYSFASPAYWAASQQIVLALAQRYGTHRAVAGWQVDNEFGCHSTVRTYDESSLAGVSGYVLTGVCWGVVCVAGFWTGAVCASHGARNLPSKATTGCQQQPRSSRCPHSVPGVAAAPVRQPGWILRRGPPHQSMTESIKG